MEPPSNRAKSALEDAISFWEGKCIAETLDELKFDQEDYPLCRAFVFQQGFCDGCPIDDLPNFHCQNLPYNKVVQAVRRGKFEQARNAAWDELARLRQIRTDQAVRKGNIDHG